MMACVGKSTAGNVSLLGDRVAQGIRCQTSMFRAADTLLHVRFRVTSPRDGHGATRLTPSRPWFMGRLRCSIFYPHTKKLLNLDLL